MTKTVIVVDNSEAIRKLVKFSLRLKGYYVETVDNGAQAWDMLSKNNFAMVMVDSLLPLMEGFELLVKIKKDSRLKNIPVIVFVPENDAYSVNKSLEIGAQACLVKPFQAKELLAKVDDVWKLNADSPR